MKKAIIIFFLFFLTFPTITYGNGDAPHIEEGNIFSEKGVVTEIVSNPIIKDSEDGHTFGESSQIVKVKITTGKYKNEVFLVENNLSGNKDYDIIVEKGDHVVLAVEEDTEGIPTVYISDFVRDKYIFYILGAFALVIILVGGLKGFKSLITLSITAIIIFVVMLPMILKGYNPIPITILSATFITIVTFLIIGGINVKSLSSIIGTMGGVFFAGTLAYIVGNLAKLTGLSSEEANMLIYIPQNIEFNFRGLLFSGIIIGTLGAVMDVAMSIASSMFEMRELNPDITPSKLMAAGMNVGKDVMGTMSNTLILAYTGSSIPLLLLFMAYEISPIKALNMDLIATEIIRAFVGSIGLIISIPITALVSSLILKLKK